MDTKNTNIVSYEESYQKYVQNRKQKYGDEFGEGYIGSAFDKPTDIFPDIDGDYLRNIMPNKHIPIRANHLDEIEADCIKLMKAKALEKNYFCRYTVPGLFPGVPLYDPAAVMKQLYERLIKRKNISVFADTKRENTLFISWTRDDKKELPKSRIISNQNKSSNKRTDTKQTSEKPENKPIKIK